MAGVRKGRGRELGRETTREGGAPHTLSRAPKFPLPLSTPATQAKFQVVLTQKAECEERTLDYVADLTECKTVFLAHYVRLFGSLHVSGKLPTYPSPKPTFCPK